MVKSKKNGRCRLPNNLAQAARQTPNCSQGRQAAHPNSETAGISPVERGAIHAVPSICNRAPRRMKEPCVSATNRTAGKPLIFEFLKPNGAQFVKFSLKKTGPLVHETAGGVLQPKIGKQGGPSSRQMPNSLGAHHPLNSDRRNSDKPLPEIAMRWPNTNWDKGHPKDVS